jgi:hypothetical protein
MRRITSSSRLSDGSGDFDIMSDSNMDELGKAIDEHAVILGRLAIAWNQINPVLCNLFLDIAHPANQAMGRAIWNAILNDRAQRGMLAAAVEASATLPKGYKARIAWGLGEILALENQRDTALHSPYVPDEMNGVLKMSAFHQTGHNRAVQLRYADLGDLFHANATDMLDLAQYFAFLIDRLDSADESKPWPQKPSLRRKRPPKTPAEQSQKTTQK